MDRYVKRGARDEIADIHVTGEFPGRHAAITTRFFPRDGQRTREWLERNHDAGKKLGRHLVEIEIEIFHLAVRVERRELAEQPGDVEVGSVGAGHDLVQRHLQYIAGLRSLDIDWAFQRVRAATRKIRPRLLDLFDSRAWNDLVVAVHHGLEHDRIAGIHT